MPTADRLERAPRAILDFLQQDYPKCELVILDDGDEPLTVPDDPRIRLVRCERRSLGWKREKLVELARGEVLVLWDDDDWHGPRRVTAQLEPLLAGYEASVFCRVVSYDEMADRYWESPDERWFCSGTMAFTRAYHARGGFIDMGIGTERKFFAHKPKRGVVAFLDGREHYTVVRHGSHLTVLSYELWTPLSEGAQARTRCRGTPARRCQQGRED